MAVRRTGGLGKGLDALIPSRKPSEPAVKPVSDLKNKEKRINAPEKQVRKSDENTDLEKSISKEEKAAENIVNNLTLTAATDQPVSPAENIEQDIKGSAEQESFSDKEIKIVKISLVEPNRNQPRRHFDEDSLIELSDSIKQYGIIQPLLVSRKKDYFEIIAGERRWRAAKIAGLKEVPVIVKEFSDIETVEISLIENIQREDLNPIEEAMAYKRLLEEFSLKQDEIAERVSKSRTAVANAVRLLKLDEKVQEMLIDDMISAGHARAILALPTGEMQIQAASKVFDEKLSVRETEKLVKTLTAAPKAHKEPPRSTTEDAIFEKLEEQMKEILGTKVSINRKKNNKGKIEIEYYSKDELERIIDLIQSVR